MMGDETKKGRENGRGSSSGGRASKAETAGAVPLVSAKRGKFESLKDAKIEAVVFAQLKDYKAFVKEIEGEEPEDGAIVSAALEMLFKMDAGFERWLQTERKKVRQPTETNGSKPSARTNTLDASQTGIS